MAVRALRGAGIDFVPHLYRYEPGGGATPGAAALGVDPHHVIKTLIMQTETGNPLIAPDDPTVRAVASDVPLDLDRSVFDLNDTTAVADFILAEVGL